ncbi:hypothetical protein E6W36_10025 [Hankyongella ginsenosidimutans]|uniref:Uncharacterized protein n=1 Tax=Hankyongella ginsenosidimutans TaxID=1763828 RepID=A0A4D7C8F5_9SPHN|nr:hypothetical protein [Hankyongella ginsenosidimutans]QCI79748.1 hypothetical protein E6W36_10025 [Hankyongella ginsenosidimutans]
MTIGPLADGGRTGARVPMTPQVRALAAPLEPASVSASTRMRRGESLASALARAGASRSIAKDAQRRWRLSSAPSGSRAGPRCMSRWAVASAPMSRARLMR